MKKVISVVVPIYNEAEGICRFLDGELLPTLNDLSYDFEVILMNDGSKDKTLEKIKQCENKHGIKMEVVSFSRNFGKEMALTAGINRAKGDAVILIDADGQHPVEMIGQMVKKWEDGADIVTAVRDQNTTKHKMGSRVYYTVMKLMGNKKIVVGALDFRLLDRKVVDEYNKFTEQNRLARGLIDWLGFEQVYVKVRTKNRLVGQPTYSFKKLVRLTVDSLASVSRTPLLIFGYIGLIITLLSGMFGLFILIEQYILGDPLHLEWSGAVAMSVFVSFLVGLVLISQAITALYISQIHVESKNRPLYVIDKEKSFKLKAKK